MKTNVLLTGDIHLANRRKRNLDGDPLFRLNQFNRLADRFVSYSKAHSITEVWFAGDLVDKAIMRPEECHALHGFIQKLLNAGLKIKFTLGNHDVATKSETDDSANRSIVPLLLDYPNIEYMHRKHVTISGVTIAFQNWEYDQSKIEWFDHADLFIGHVNILPGSFGAPFDQSRFDLALVGDIHNPCVNGKAVAIGCPIQSNAGDAPDGTFIHLTLKDSKIEWHHVNTIVPDEFDFLRVYRSDRLPKGYTPQKYDVIDEIKVSAATENLTDEQVSELFDSEATLTAALSEETEAVAKKIQSVLALTEVEPLDIHTLSFGVLEIENFRSIEQRTFDISKLHKLNRITGHIGQGKSSIVRAMNFVLVNTGSPKTLAKINRKSAMSVSLTFNYRGFEQTVVRTGQYISKWIVDGVEQEASGKTELTNLFKAENPWLAVWKLMYQDQMSTGFLLSMSTTSRVAFLSRLLKFDNVLTTHNSLKAEAKAAKKVVDATNTASVAAKAVLASKLEALDGKSDSDIEAAILEQQEKAILDRAVILESQEGVAAIAEIQRLIVTRDKAAAACTEAREAHDASAVPAALVDVSDDVALIAMFNAFPTQTSLEGLKVKGIKARETLDNPPDKCGECEGVLVVSPEWTTGKQAVLEEAKNKYRESAAEFAKRAAMQPDFDAATIRIATRKGLEAKHKAYALSEAAVASLTATSDAAAASVSEHKYATSDLLTEQAECVANAEEATESLLATQVSISDLKKTQQQFEDYKAQVALVDVCEDNVKSVGEAKAIIDAAVYSTSMEGPVLSKTMAAAGEVLSDGMIQVITTKQTGSGTVPDFTVELYVTELGHYVPYDELSGGQLCTVDCMLIIRLSKLLGSMPLVILDEALHFCNEETIIELMSLLQVSTIDKLLLIAHGSDTPQITNYIEA